jgi:uncharacterized protein YhhL (DUF1145 family)
LSARQLAATFAAIGCVSGAVIWTALMLLHLVSTWDFPKSLRIELLFGAAAMMAFLHGIRLASLGTRIPPAVTQSLAVGLPCAVWYTTFTWPMGSPLLSMTLASLLIFVAGYAVLRSTITRTSRLYSVVLATGFRG